MSTKKTKTMAFKGGDTMRHKIVVNNNFIGQTNAFIHTGCTIPYQKDKHISVK